MRPCPEGDFARGLRTGLQTTSPDGSGMTVWPRGLPARKGSACTHGFAGHLQFAGLMHPDTPGKIGIWRPNSRAQVSRLGAKVIAPFGEFCVRQMLAVSVAATGQAWFGRASAQLRFDVDVRCARWAGSSSRLDRGCRVQTHATGTAGICTGIAWSCD